MVFICIYMLICLLLLCWFLGFAYIGMDKYDRRYIGWAETGAILLVSALCWPVLLVRKPLSFMKPSRLYVLDSYSAQTVRERDRIRRELSRCSNRVRFEMSNEGLLLGGFEFPAEAMAAYLAQRTDNDGYGSLRDLSEIQDWVSKADHMNGQASEVPWIWGSFKLLAAELVEVGLGSCFCGTCRAHYENWELESGSGNGSLGWIAVIVKCPKGHEVMKFDLMKPFCSRRRSPEPMLEDVANREPHVPSFLKKGG